MMSQVKNYKLLAISFGLLALVLTGCKKQDPFVDPGKEEDPHWVLSDDNNMTASMTAIVRVSFTNQPGTLAAFIGNDCCGIAEYKEDYGLYWLYISPVMENGGDVKLRFYSPELKRIFDATETFPFRNETHLGTVAEPYTPEWQYSSL